jgi:hypothetical protein
MNIGKFHVSKHARLRMAQRNLTPAEMETILEFGRCEYRTGAKYFFLGIRDLPQAKTRELARLVGTTVITICGEILTVYRDHHAIAKIKRKSKLKRRHHHKG